MDDNVTSAHSRHSRKIAMVVEKALEAVFVNRDLGAGRAHDPGRRESVRSSRFRSMFQRADSKGLLKCPIARGALGCRQFSRAPVQMNADFLEYAGSYDFAWPQEFGRIVA